MTFSLANSNHSNWMKDVQSPAISYSDVLRGAETQFIPTMAFPTMVAVTMRPRRCLGLWIMTMIMFLTKISASLAITQRRLLRGGPKPQRSLQGPTLTTTNCNVIRLEDYQAELQLLFKYLVEFESGGSRSLRGLEDAIAHAVAQELDSCDAMDRPLYKVNTNTQHDFSKSEYCAPLVDGNTCHVVTGATAILLDSDSANVQDKAYRIIAVALNHTDYLKQFASSVVRAQFIDPLVHTLVLSPKPDNATVPGSVTATVAVAAASVSFLVATIFCYGLMRRENRNHPEPSVRHKNNRTRNSGHAVVANPIGIRSRRHFVRLEEFAAASPTSFVTASFSASPGPDCTPSITWSISDMTSDSASIYSSLSRTTSKLERIEEEEVEADDEYEDNNYYEEGSSDFMYPPRRQMEMPITHSLFGVPTSPLKFGDVEKFYNLDLEDEPIDFPELEGCRFVEENEDYDLRLVTPLELEDEDLHHFAPIMPEVDDLQISLDDEIDEQYEPLPSILGDSPSMAATSPKVGTDEDSLPLETQQTSPGKVEDDGKNSNLEEDVCIAVPMDEMQAVAIIMDVSTCGIDPAVDQEEKPKEIKEDFKVAAGTNTIQPDSDLFIDKHKSDPTAETGVVEDATCKKLCVEEEIPEERSFDAKSPETPKKRCRNDDSNLDILQELNIEHPNSTVVDVSRSQEKNLQEWMSQILEDVKTKHSGRAD